MQNWKRVSFTIVTALFLAVCVQAAALAGPLEDGKAAYDGRHDYQAALKLLQPLATQGNPEAQLYVGVMYENGQGVKKSYAQAMKWYRKAALKGNVFAQHNLGAMYFNGAGVKKNYTEAAKWLRKAAEQGNSDAQDNLGWLYTTGHGVTQDVDEGRKWFLRGANQGNFDAMSHLTDGYAMESNEQELYFWYSIIANLPNADKQWGEYRDHEAKWITPEQKAAVDVRLQEWKPVPEKH